MFYVKFCYQSIPFISKKRCNNLQLERYYPICNKHGATKLALYVLNYNIDKANVQNAHGRRYIGIWFTEFTGALIVISDHDSDTMSLTNNTMGHFAHESVVNIVLSQIYNTQYNISERMSQNWLN